MSMPELKRGDLEGASCRNHGGGWLDGACAAVSAAALSGGDHLVRIILGNSNPKSPFRIGAVAVVTQ